jgi:hypothetical protein
MSTFTRIAVRKLVPWIVRGNEMWAYSSGRPKTRSTVRDELQADADLQVHRFEFEVLGFEFAFRLRVVHVQPRVIIVSGADPASR